MQKYLDQNTTVDWKGFGTISRTSVLKYGVTLMKREKSSLVENNVYSAKLPTQQKPAWVHKYTTQNKLRILYILNFFV